MNRHAICLKRLVAILGATLIVACAARTVPRPPLTSLPPTSIVVTPAGGISPLPSATFSLAALSPLDTPTRQAGSLPAVTAASPLSTPTAEPFATVTSVPPPPPPILPLPSATPLIAVSTPTRLQSTPSATRAPASPVPTKRPLPTTVVVPTQPLIPTLPAVPTRTPAPTMPPTPSQTPSPTVPPVLVTAWVSDPNPEPGVDVAVYGRLLVDGKPVSGQGMVAHWHLKGHYVDCVGDTLADGTAHCSVNTYGLPPGFTVRIEVFIKYNEAPYRAATELTIR